MAAPITLWLDFASPYAWCAIDAADRLAAEHGREIIWRPFLVWAVLKAQGVAPPMDAPAKRAYFVADMTRSAAFHRVEYCHPIKFPVSSHRAARLYYALAEDDPVLARKCGRDLFAAYFVEGADVSDEQTLVELAARRGIDPERARASIEREMGRRRLAEAIDAAVAAGVCGSPWFEVDGEAFFGADRLPQIEWRLSGKHEGLAHG